MRALLDVNVLIALLDADHTMHARATEWLVANVHRGWSSCPITQNGCIRIMSNPNYPNAVPVGAIVERLTQAVATPRHQFWPDDLSILDDGIADRTRIHGPRQVTDLYLLALAVRHRGCFVSFDSSIPLAAVRRAEPKHLVAL